MALGTEERLRIEAAQKDPSRFAELYEEHFGRIYAFVVRRVGERGAAQDVTSEVFQQALASLPRYQWRGLPFSAWLYRIAANAVADHRQRAGREVAIEQRPEPAREELDQVEDRATLFRLVDRLPVDQRRVIEMRFAEGRSIRDIATLLGRSEGAVKQLQWRGLETLRTRMGRRNG